MSLNISVIQLFSLKSLMDIVTDVPLLQETKCDVFSELLWAMG